MGSQFNGSIVIVQRMLLIALATIRRGTIRKRKKAHVAIEGVVVR
jgi:hypothetical protein